MAARGDLCGGTGRKAVGPLMEKLPAVPAEVLSAQRAFQNSQQWHRFAFEIFPAPFGNGVLLDVGCGGGGVSARASAAGWKVTGIDISPGNVESMRALGMDAVVVDLNGDFPFGDGSFSCVAFIEVAEHLIQAEHGFSEIARVLSPGGKVLFTTPNNASYRRRMKALKGRAPDDEGYHFRFWVKEQLESKWENAGMRIELANSYGYLPFVDTLTFYKARTGKRRIYRIGRRYEALFADRFVWLLTKR
ncbi:MAG TPA: class I SAM-dependent methyltransferase [Candidatus Limnocylindria bacterium]|nr:class I SAM-dependent methyltransferase [Candidatus Limnocylindria bacterium]